MFFNPEAASSRVTAAWLADVWAKHPCVKLDNGNIRTGLVRFSFPWLFKAQKAMEPGKPDKFALTSLFPAGADLDPLKAEAQAVAVAKWGAQTAALTLHSPFRDQSEKSAKFNGYVPGSIFITSTGERRPPLVDQNLAPITDENRVYPGVWGFVTLRCFDFEAKNPAGHVVKRGISFGLQSVMVVADDENLGGGGSDPNADFAGVSIDQAVNPSELFGGGTTAGGAAPQEVSAASLF